MYQILAADHFEHRFLFFVFKITFTDFFEHKRSDFRVPNPESKTFGAQGLVSPVTRMASDL